MPLCILCQLYWCTLQIFTRKIAKVVICDWDTTKINRLFPQLKHKISTQIHHVNPPPSYKSPSTKLIQRRVSANTSPPIESKSYQLSAKGYSSFKHAVQNAKGPKPHKLQLWPLSRAKQVSTLSSKNFASFHLIKHDASRERLHQLRIRQHQHHGEQTDQQLLHLECH